MREIIILGNNLLLQYKWKNHLDFWKLVIAIENRKNSLEDRKLLEFLVLRFESYSDFLTLNNKHERKINNKKKKKSHVKDVKE